VFKESRELKDKGREGVDEIFRTRTDAWSQSCKADYIILSGILKSGRGRRIMEGEGLVSISSSVTGIENRRNVSRNIKNRLCTRVKGISNLILLIKGPKGIKRRLSIWGVKYTVL